MQSKQKPMIDISIKLTISKIYFFDFAATLAKSILEHKEVQWARSLEEQAPIFPPQVMLCVQTHFYLSLNSFVKMVLMMPKNGIFQLVKNRENTTLNFRFLRLDWIGLD